VAKADQNRYNSSSLARGLEILRLFRPDQPTLSLVEIANLLGVSRTTPFRLLFTLQTLGYLRQDEQTKRYELTPKVLELGFAYLNTLQLPELARPYLERLRDETGASAHLGILDGSEVVYVARVPARGVSTVSVTIGSRLPAHATALGKTLLAYQPEEQRKDRLLLSDLHSFTNETKSMINDLLKELGAIRQQGYAISNGEFESGVRSVAAPIFDSTGNVIAAVNVAAPAAIFPDDFWGNFVLPAVLETADQLSRVYGEHASQKREGKT
jgi:IclR family pca regulon transcriptional regulator